MTKHHYTPQFLLRNWATDGKFVAHYYDLRLNKLIQNRKASVVSACQINNLNVLLGVPKEESDAPETKVFTPLVDTPAAEALRTILKQGVEALTISQRCDWARLLISFGVRNPDTLRAMGPVETRKAFAIVEASASGPAHLEAEVTRLIKRNMALHERNAPLHAAMAIPFDSDKLNVITKMNWAIHRWDKNAILIGDRPLLASPRMLHPNGIALDNPSCLIMLPIAKDAVFFASPVKATVRKIEKTPLRKVARIVNEETIFRAKTVFAADTSLESFLTPRIEGAAKGTWEPGKRFRNR